MVEENAALASREAFFSKEEWEKLGQAMENLKKFSDLYCTGCKYCQPCPAGIDIGLANKYYDLALAGDRIAANHYDKLSTKADACLQCGHCESRCPFGVEQMTRMTKIAEYFGA